MLTNSIRLPGKEKAERQRGSQPQMSCSRNVVPSQPMRARELPEQGLSASSRSHQAHAGGFTELPLAEPSCAFHHSTYVPNSTTSQVTRIQHGDWNRPGAQKYMPGEQMGVSAGAAGARFPEQSAQDASTPVSPRLGIAPQESTAGSQREICRPTFTAGFTKQPKGEAAEYPSTDRWSR